MAVRPLGVLCCAVARGARSKRSEPTDGAPEGPGAGAELCACNTHGDGLSLGGVQRHTDGEVVLTRYDSLVRVSASLAWRMVRACGTSGEGRNAAALLLAASDRL